MIMINNNNNNVQKLMKTLLPLVILLILPANTHSASFGDPGKSLWIAHGICMFLAWGVVFPLGAMIAVYRRFVGKDKKYFTIAPSFYPPHFYFQVFGIILNIVAMICAARACFLVYGTGNPFDPLLWDFVPSTYPSNRHIKLGVFVVIMLAVQSILGYWHHLIKHAHDEKVKSDPQNTPAWKRPLIPSWFHVILGVVVLIVSWVTIPQGLQIYFVIFKDTPGLDGKLKIGYSVIGILACIYALLYIKEKITLCTTQKENNDDMINNNQPKEEGSKLEEIA